MISKKIEKFHSKGEEQIEKEIFSKVMSVTDYGFVLQEIIRIYACLYTKDKIIEIIGKCNEEMKPFTNIVLHI